MRQLHPKGKGMERKMIAKRITHAHRLKTGDGIIHPKVVEGVEIVARPVFPRSPPQGFWVESSIRLEGRDDEAYLAGEFASCR
jgi:hypothetical protein